MEIGKYIFLEMTGNTALCCGKKLDSEVQDEYHVHAQNRAGYQKVFSNCIISAGYTGSHRKLAASKGRSSSLTLILHGSSRKMRDRPFLSVSTSTYYNIDSFMNIVIGMHNSCRKGICQQVLSLDIQSDIRPKTFKQTYFSGA